MQFMKTICYYSKGNYCICFIHTTRIPWWLRWWRILLQCRRPGFDCWVGKIPWSRVWQLTSVFLPRESPWTEEPGRLYSPWGHKESDMTEWLSTYNQLMKGECRITHDVLMDSEFPTILELIIHFSTPLGHPWINIC